MPVATWNTIKTTFVEDDQSMELYFLIKNFYPLSLHSFIMLTFDTK